MRVAALLPVIFGLPAFANLVYTQFPALLLPMKSHQPDTAFQTQKDAMVSYDRYTGSEHWTAANFNVPDNEANICRLRFPINTNTSKNPPLSLKGEAPFSISISRVEPKLVNGRTTWKNKPSIIEHYATYVVSMTGATEVVSKWFQCPKGDVAQFFIHPASQRNLEFYWFELNYTAADGGPHGIVLEMHT